MASTCKHEFGHNVVNTKMPWRTMMYRRCYLCSVKFPFAVKMIPCKSCRVFVHERCVPPVVVESAPEETVSNPHVVPRANTVDTANYPRSILKVTKASTEINSRSIFQASADTARNRRRIDQVTAANTAINSRRNIGATASTARNLRGTPAATVAARSSRGHPTRENDREGRHVRFGECTGGRGNATQSGNTAELVSAQEPKSAASQMARGSGGETRRRRRNRRRRTNATATARNDIIL